LPWHWHWHPAPALTFTQLAAGPNAQTSSIAVSLGPGSWCGFVRPFAVCLRCVVEVEVDPPIIPKCQMPARLLALVAPSKLPHRLPSHGPSMAHDASASASALPHLTRPRALVPPAFQRHHFTLPRLFHCFSCLPLSYPPCLPPCVVCLPAYTHRRAVVPSRASLLRPDQIPSDLAPEP
jgi:hypothetical protein